MLRRVLIVMLMMATCLCVPAQTGKSQRKPAVTQKNTKRATQKKKQAAKRAATRKKPTRNTTADKQAKGQAITVKGLQNERRTLQKNKAANIRKKEQLKSGVKRGMENLMLLDQEIAHQRKVIDTIRNDVSQLSNHIGQLDSQLVVLSGELEERRTRYMKSMRYMHRNRSVQNQLMFVCSADNFNQMLRRLRFTREYAAYQKAQGEAVKLKQQQVDEKRRELNESRNRKTVLLARGEKEQKSLEGKQDEQKRQVEQLKKQQNTVEALILEQQRKEAELNALIDKLIAEEIAREKARLEAEARQKAAEAAKRERLARKAEKERKAAEQKDRKDKGKNTTKRRERVVTEESSRKEESYKEPAEGRKLSGGFEANRGRLPLPITGAYRLMRGFGTYSPEGLSHVRLHSNGWYLKGQPGAKAQCIFDGVVSGISYQNGFYIVTVRHGRYISAYINLASVSVKKGQQVKARSVLGSLGSDHTLQFQLRNWSTLLNPSQWLSR